ncbi:hypothetical protein [Neorhizobium galegae]|uniref:hypothetical protein n=1 Tax=Neorhizobium galegae TaxID=399 RepID=UPI00138E28F1|nr:hypothetical protein [Neorhizobium galegae]MCQ1850281.1 hypothetical protein [Neorhizobium galegae]
MDATTIAIAVLLKNVISYPKTRLFNGIPQTQPAPADPTIVAIQGHKTDPDPDVKAAKIPPRSLIRRNGIAIRACFGKPAFVSMQHGRRQAGPFLEANNGNSDDLRPFQEEKPKPRDC